AASSKGSERANDRWPCEPGENTRISEVAQTRHLPVAPPRLFGRTEVETPLGGQKGNEFEPALGLHDLSQGCVDRVPQGLRTEDRRPVRVNLSVPRLRLVRHH